MAYGFCHKFSFFSSKLYYHQCTLHIFDEVAFVQYRFKPQVDLNNLYLFDTIMILKLSTTKYKCCAFPRIQIDPIY